MSSDLMQKSEMYSLPQTALNWKASLLLALFSMLVGITVLFFFGRKSNA
jgi:LPXTG-motif cell wall-anchored protein